MPRHLGAPSLETLDSQWFFQDQHQHSCTTMSFFFLHHLSGWCGPSPFPPGIVLEKNLISHFILLEIVRHFDVEPNIHFSFSCLLNVAYARQIFGTWLKLCVFGNSRGMKTAYKVDANMTAWMFVFIKAALVPVDATVFSRTVILL